MLVVKLSHDLSMMFQKKINILKLGHFKAALISVFFFLPDNKLNITLQMCVQ